MQSGYPCNQSEEAHDNVSIVDNKLAYIKPAGINR